jgi:hypothetical protein
MIISDERWNDIIKATEAGIAKWNALVAKHKVPDKFSVKVRDEGGYSVLLTEHDDGYQREHRAVVREVATGEMRAAKVVKKRRKGVGVVITGFSIWRSDPTTKWWKSLPNKSADDAVRQLKLTDFFVPISASVIPSETISPAKEV